MTTTTALGRPGPDADKRDKRGGPVLPAGRARQGATGHNVRYVLAVSTAAAAFILAVVWFLYFFA